MMNRSEYAMALRAQGQMYRLLSQCMARPTVELVERLELGLVSEAFRTGFGDAGDAGAEKALRAVEGFCLELGGLSREESRLRLEVDYNRLFVGPGHLLAPPYESAYLGTPFSGGGDDDLDGENSIDGRHLLTVRDAYRQAGFGISKDFHDLADNFFVELDFVAHLYHAQADAVEKGEDEKADELEVLCFGFVAEHLSRWSGRFLSKVESGAALPFYPAVVELACVLVAFEVGRG